MQTDLNGITVNEVAETADLYIGGVPGEEHARAAMWLNVPEPNRNSNNAQIWLTNVTTRISGEDSVVLNVMGVGKPSILIDNDAIHLRGPILVPIEGESGMATLTVKRVNGSLEFDISE